MMSERMRPYGTESDGPDAPWWAPLHDDGRTASSRERLNALWTLAGLLAKSGYLPAGMERPEQAFYVMLKGAELGLPPVQSLTAINVIDGNPTLSGALLMALCIRDAGCVFEVERREADGAAVTIHRPDWPAYTAEFTSEDAERAELLEEEHWRRYPKAMYWWRAVAEACRTVCPDVVAGLYTPEELEAADLEAGGDEAPSSQELREALEERYREAWRELVPDDEDRRRRLRDRWVGSHPRLPDAHGDWTRRHWAVATRELEREGPELIRELAVRPSDVPDGAP